MQASLQGELARNSPHLATCATEPGAYTRGVAADFGRPTMTRMSSIFVAALTLATGSARADEPKPPTADEVKEAQGRVSEYLKGIKGAEAARVTALSTTGTGGETFHDHILFSVLFPQYPVARVAPEPLKSSNVVAVPKKLDGKPVPLTDVKELGKFFKDHARPAKNGIQIRDAVTAWLRATSELNQDGFYKFTVKAGEVFKDKEKEGVDTCSGEAPVEPTGGNKGEIKATLTFKDGKLTAADTKVNLTPGVRPICQATKLLDPDPIVRAMAEQSIRILGSAAKPYLDEQRAKANAELREAIDHMWVRIVEEKR